MPQVRIKDKAPQAKRGKPAIWEQICKAGIIVNKVIETRGAFVVICSEQTVEELLKATIISQFKEANLEILIPPETNANRTIVVRGIDERILDHSCDEIKEELQRCNDWAQVNEVIIIPNIKHLIKIKFANTTSVKKSVDNGLLLFNQSFSGKSIEKELFINLTPCYRCYSYDHKTTNCPTPDKKICSECANEGHTYRECKNQEKKCINCGSNHRTLAARCPIRKGIIRDKEKQIRETRKQKQDKTYSGAVANNLLPPQNPIPLNSTTPIIDSLGNEGNKLPENASIKILTSIIYAHHIDSMYPGQFQTQVDHMFKINGLPKVKFPQNIPPLKDVGKEIHTDISKKIKRIRTESGASGTDATDTEGEMEIVEHNKRKRQTGISPNKQNKEKKSKENETMPPPSPLTIPSQKTTERSIDNLVDNAGIYLVTSEGKPVPEGFSNNDEIINHAVFVTKLAKYYFTNKHYNPHDIEDAIHEGKIKLSRARYKQINIHAFENLMSGQVLSRERRNSK